MKYFLYTIHQTFGENVVVLRRDDGAQIPFSEDNPDYREYLIWVSLGNTPEEWINE